MKRKHVILTVLLVMSAALLAFAGKDPADPIVEATPRADTRMETSTARAGAGSVVTIAALHPRGELVGPANGAHHDLFGSLSMVPPLPSAAPANAEVPPLPPALLTPSMPFTYLGKEKADGRWKVYLARGNDTLIVSEKMVIDGGYRVDAITPPTMKLVYLPQKLVQTLDIGSAD